MCHSHTQLKRWVKPLEGVCRITWKSMLKIPCSVIVLADPHTSSLKANPIQPLSKGLQLNRWQITSAAYNQSHKCLHTAGNSIWRASAPCLALHTPLFYQTSQIGHPVPSCSPSGIMPRRSTTSLWRHCARTVSLHGEERSYLVEGDVPIRVMNGLITGSKQSLGDERRTGVYREGRESQRYRLHPAWIREGCTAWLHVIVLGCVSICAFLDPCCSFYHRVCLQTL